jgi:hypothetical protein
MPIAHPLAYCPTCRSAFPIATARAGGTFVVQNSTTKCPNGHFARILNAHYQAIEADIRATLETQGQAVHKAVLTLWQRLSRREISPEQAQAEAERTKSGLGSIFSAENFADPTRKAILEALIADFVAKPQSNEEPDADQQNAAIAVPSMTAATATRELRERRRGSNGAFQRSLRHKQRMLMNPRIR